ncbi:unnamed protein product [Phytophthora fragariaefolia]|uniref:Unnamed protein product n=1 Tax=Phytophthora fragariaefolia TaxID=1490495 RepID=A0A9W6TMA2_9STRA|nr:unnamed protein product [Phytophthora fragariaefolia]
MQQFGTQCLKQPHHKVVSQPPILMLPTPSSRAVGVPCKCPGGVNGGSTWIAYGWSCVLCFGDGVEADLVMVVNVFGEGQQRGVLAIEEIRFWLLRMRWCRHHVGSTTGAGRT